MAFDVGVATATETATDRPRIDASVIRASAITLLERPPQQPETVPEESLFKTQSANEWLRGASERPMPRRLFGDLWFENELCIAFADTGKGKSIFAVQIADHITTGNSDGFFPTETAKQEVLYFDFELSDKQFEARYSRRGDTHFSSHYRFDDLFVRSEIDPNSFAPGEGSSFDQYLTASIEAEIRRRGVKVLIIDNITYLRSATETAKDALPLMKELNRLKKQYGLSILVLAHTPKRDLSRPITVNDLQGSKMLSNFADSIFAIGESSKDKSIRYIKQIKVRNAEMQFDAENVVTCQITKPDNFLRFEFMNFGCEREHLNMMTESTRLDLIERTKTLANKRVSQREISKELGIALGTVNKYINA